MQSSPAPAAPSERHFDDSEAYAEARSWIWAEFRRGRMPEEMVAALRDTGWSLDKAEWLVEEGRKESRSLRGIVTRDDVVRDLNKKWSKGSDAEID